MELISLSPCRNTSPLRGSRSIPPHCVLSTVFVNVNESTVLSRYTALARRSPARSRPQDRNHVQALPFFLRGLECFSKGEIAT
jgi:hypothetical protein